jgi:hypothetical protein
MKNKFFKDLKINSVNVRTGENRLNLDEVISLMRDGEFLKKRIVEHHRLYHHAIKGTANENVWVNIFNEDLGLGQRVGEMVFDWHPESHKIGADITVPSLMFPRISIKTGKVTKSGRVKTKTQIKDDHKVKYSSHRLTTYKDLEEILGFLKKSHCDITFLLSPDVKNKKYYWIVQENLNFEKLDWAELYSKTNTQKGWVGLGVDVRAEIHTSLSSQLWVEIKLSSDKIIHMEEICVC